MKRVVSLLDGGNLVLPTTNLWESTEPIMVCGPGGPITDPWVE